MKIMIVDRDRDMIETIEGICRDMGTVDLTVEISKNKAIEMARETPFDAIFVDPAPQNHEIRPFMIGVRRTSQTYTPVVLMSHQMSLEEATKNGANTYIQKPFDEATFKKVVENFKNLSDFNKVITDEATDFPSKDGIISKSAFNQIFISCLDRADRYGEQTYLTLAKIDNVEAIRANHGDDVANEICANLKKYTMKIRRLSDIAGHIADNEICLMLMRPKNEDEPKMAINRFAESMTEYAELISVGDAKAVIKVEMMCVPTGEITFSQNF